MSQYFSIIIGTLLLTLPACGHSPPTGPQTVQEHVHHLSHTVMPFDMSKTLHIFKMTEQGGIQQVVVRESRWQDQVPLIQMHLKHEAEQFQKGNFADPSALHGANMPGLKELMHGATAIKVSYRDLPDGGEIAFKTNGLKLLTAIHRWFGAQLSEHGADAKAE